MNGLEGKVIAVTGAGAGIGAGILRAVQDAGARAWGLEMTEAGLDRVREAGAGAVAVDVTDTERLRAALRQVREEAGQLDGLVNNAGVTLTAPFLEAETEMWERLWRTNQRSVLVGCQEAARIMVADGRGGALVNVASVHGSASDRGYEGYAATKGGILAMSRAMAWSLGEHGIRVNALSPGLTMTEGVSGAAEDPAARRLFASWHADGQVGTSVDEIGGWRPSCCRTGPPP